MHDDWRFVMTKGTNPGPSTRGPGQSPTGDESSASTLARGTVLGRYLVLGEIGRGGMGVVYAAFDPELDRRVALKVLHAEDEHTQRALLREARVLAKFAHPNVATVFDAGVSEGFAYIAMELVDGGDLRAWLEHEPRSIEEVLAAFLEAGRGLRAAHEKGMVHRDFKPGNILIGKDGRVRVADFGLAQLAPSTDSKVTPGHELRSLARTSPAEGGTPGFMAPEIGLGQVPDARADQYGFCVSLVWAMTGSKPDELEDLDGALACLRAPARKALLRGLEPDPQARVESMKELLEALEGPPSAPSKGAPIAAALTIAAAVLLWWVGSRGPGGVPRDRCALGEETLDAVWSSARAEAIESKLREVEGPAAEQAADRIRRGLDDHARRWAEVHAEICALGEASARRAEGLRCLDRRLEQLDVLVTAIAEGRPPPGKSVDAVARLVDPVGCTAPDWLPPTRIAEPALELRPQVEEGRRILELARAYESTGQYEPALEQTSLALAHADALDYAPLQAEALFWTGMVDMEQGRYEQAETTLRRSFMVAIAVGHDEILVRAGSLLLYTIGSSQGDPQRAEIWAELTAAELERWGQGTIFEAIYLDSLSAVSREGGELARAREAATRSLTLRQDLLPPEHPEIAFSQMGLAVIEFEAGRYAEAEAHARAAVSLRELAYGSDHPDLIVALSTVAAAATEQGRHGEAIEALLRALAIGEASLGADHPRLVGVRNNLAAALNREGDYAGAKRLYASVLESWIAARGKDDPQVGLAHNNLAATLLALGNLEEALEHHQRVLAIWTASLGPTHLKLAIPLNGLATDSLVLGRCEQASGYAERAWALVEASGAGASLEAYVANTRARVASCLGRNAAAREAAERAVEVGRATLGEDHPRLGGFLLTLAEAQLASGDGELALATAKLALSSAKQGPGSQRGHTKLVLAQVQLALGERARARALAREALELLPAGNRRWAAQRRDAEALLRAP